MLTILPHFLLGKLKNLLIWYTTGNTNNIPNQTKENNRKTTFLL